MFPNFVKQFEMRAHILNKKYIQQGNWKYWKLFFDPVDPITHKDLKVLWDQQRSEYW